MNKRCITANLCFGVLHIDGCSMNVCTLMSLEYMPAYSVDERGGRPYSFFCFVFLCIDA